MLEKLILNKKLRILVWLTFILPTIAFIFTSISYFVYLFWPYDVAKVIDIELSPSASHLNISVHGVKDSPANWSQPLQQVMNRQANGGEQNVSIDWRPFSDNPLICSVTAKRIGEALGERITSETSINSIHAVAHSCGSFVILGLCESIKDSKPSINIQTTYLDPVSIYAGVFWDYGIEYFGSCADFSDAYIDTGDTVPGSNSALPNAVSFDVTQIRMDQGNTYAPHNWPPHYYLDAYAQHHVPLLRKNPNISELFEKGKLLIIE